MENEPLEQFREWYDTRERAALDGQSEYVKFRAAFYAGYAARPMPQRVPSREALDYREHGRHPLAGPSPETLECVQRNIKDDRLPRPYPAEFEHTDVVWHRTGTGSFGPPGPVPTPVDPENG